MMTSDNNRLDGCDFGDVSPNDYRLEFGDQSLPVKVDLREHCTPVENQGQIGSCTANACVGALEHAYTKRDGHSPELSRLFVYYNTRRLKGTTGQDSGAMINEAMAAVMAFGACESEYWPYNPGNFTQEPPKQAYLNGKLHEPIQYARVPGPDGAVQALASGYPVVFGTFLPKRLYEVATQTGLMPASEPQELIRQPSGGHCMLIVGYDTDAKVFIVRNSWGTAWGNGGYCEVPFREMALFSPPETFWTMLELEPNANFSLVKPREQNLASPAATSSPADTASNLQIENARDLRRDLDSARREIRDLAAGIRGSLSGDTPAGSEQGFGAVCYTCSGSGNCFYCGGKGVNTIAGEHCVSCYGKGLCNSCGGCGAT